MTLRLWGRRVLPIARPVLFLDRRTQGEEVYFGMSACPGKSAALEHAEIKRAGATVSQAEYEL
jgi:hypothetical protein